MACGISSGLSARCRDRLRRQGAGSDDESMCSSPCSILDQHIKRVRRGEMRHCRSLATFPMGDPTASFLGVPKFPRAVHCARFSSQGHGSGRTPPRMRPAADRSGTAWTAPEPQEPDSPLMPIEEEALYSCGPLSSLNLLRPRRYGITHPGRYGENDPMGKWHKTLLDSSMTADRELKQKLHKLRFPPLDMLQPVRKKPQLRSEPARMDGMSPAPGSPSGFERRNVVRPRTIRSMMIVDAKGRRLFSEMPFAE